MTVDQVTVTRTVHVEGVVVTESATARLPDDLTLDAVTECLRREMLAAALFNSLPSVQPKPIPPNPCPPPPLNSLN